MCYNNYTNLELNRINAYQENAALSVSTPDVLVTLQLGVKIIKTDING